jgi:hypothetical protein
LFGARGGGHSIPKFKRAIWTFQARHGRRSERRSFDGTQDLQA